MRAAQQRGSALGEPVSRRARTGELVFQEIVQQISAGGSPQESCQRGRLGSRLCRLWYGLAWDAGDFGHHDVRIESRGEFFGQWRGFAVGALGDTDKLVPAVRALGARHVGYGVRDEHYDTVGSALLWTLDKGLGAAFTSNCVSDQVGRPRASGGRCNNPTAPPCSAANCNARKALASNLSGHHNTAPTPGQVSA